MSSMSRLPAELLRLVAQAYQGSCHHTHINPTQLWPNRDCKHIRNFCLINKAFMAAMMPYALSELRVTIGLVPSPLSVLAELDSAKLRHVKVLSLFIGGASHAAEEPHAAEHVAKLLATIGKLELLELGVIGSGWEDCRLVSIFQALQRAPRLRNLTIACKDICDYEEADVLDRVLHLAERTQPQMLQMQGNDRDILRPVLLDAHLATISQRHCLALKQVDAALAGDKPIEGSKLQEAVIFGGEWDMEQVSRFAHAFSPSLRRIIADVVVNPLAAPLSLENKVLRDMQLHPRDLDGNTDALSCIDQILDVFGSTCINTPIIVCPADQTLRVVERIVDWFRAHPTSFSNLLGLYLNPPMGEACSLIPDFDQQPAWLELCKLADDMCFMVNVHGVKHSQVTEANKDRWEAKLSRYEAQ